MSQKAPDLPRPAFFQPLRADDIESFPGGKVIYLSPILLPTKSAPFRRPVRRPCLRALMSGRTPSRGTVGQV